ncbi:hypothetical protein L6241_10025 [Janibacter sp. Y6]|uniref:hypothetical protein n=1 Tax=Janibacter sp. Y6 TaxID=2913552 RepID=UPI0034A1BEED
MTEQMIVMTPVETALAVMNTLAVVSVAVALGSSAVKRLHRTELGRGLMVCLVALLMTSSAGLARRIRFEYADQVVLIAFGITVVVAWWVYRDLLRDDDT